MRRKLLFAWLLTLLAVHPVFAVDIPSFPSCLSPRGETISSYGDGVHGIVGSTTTYTGSDAVYQVTQSTLTQCFCSTDGQGIQTNWWNASSISEDQAKVLEKEGWIYVPAGNMWGLTEDPYFAKNTPYSCLPSSSATPKPSSGSGSSSSNNSTPGAVQGSSDNGTGGGEVLGLATTGNSLALILVFGSSLFFLYLGISRLMDSHHEKNS